MSQPSHPMGGGARRKPLAIILSIAIATIGLSAAPFAVSSASAATTSSSLRSAVLSDLNKWRSAQGLRALKTNTRLQAGIQDAVGFQLISESGLDGGSEPIPSASDLAALYSAPLEEGTNEFQSGGVTDPGTTSSEALEVAQGIEADSDVSTFELDNYVGIGVVYFQGRWAVDLTAVTLTPGVSYAPTPHVTISGSAKVGDTLTVHSSIKSSSSVSVEYVWISSDSGPGSGPTTSDTYTVTDDDIGIPIGAVVLVGKVGEYVSAGAAETAKVGLPSITPGAVKVDGDPYVGAILTADPGTWGPDDADVDLTYQWYRDSYPIATATGSTYTQVSADIGHQITVRVSGEAEGGGFQYLPRSVLAAAKSKTAGPLLTNPTLPSITINTTLTVGQTLTADPGVWTDGGTGTQTFTYQWEIDGKAVSGATKPTFVIPASAYSAAGETVSLAVTAHESGFSATTYVSIPTDTVAGLTFDVTGSPSYSGTAAPGSTIKAVLPTYSPGPTTVTYQWQIGGSTVSTKSSYKIPAGATGPITLIVTASKSGYVTSSIGDDDITITGAP